MAERLTWDNVFAGLLDRAPELRPVYQHLLDTEGPPIERCTVVGSAARWAQGLAGRKGSLGARARGRGA